MLSAPIKDIVSVILGARLITLIEAEREKTTVKNIKMNSIFIIPPIYFELNQDKYNENKIIFQDSFRQCCTQYCEI